MNNTIYRIQGGKSNQTITYQNNQLNFAPNRYIYFSKTRNHHQYFLQKRIEEQVKQILYQNSLTLYTNQLNSDHYYEIIQKCLLENSANFHFETIQIQTLPIFEQLLKENAINHIQTRKQPGMPERIDIRKHNGGYGLYGTWLKILQDLMITVKIRTIEIQNILEYINIFRQNKLTPQQKQDYLTFLYNAKLEIITSPPP